MALSGTLTGTKGGYTYTIKWQATQDVTNNKSTITCTHSLAGGKDWAINATEHVSCNIGGTGAKEVSLKIVKGDSSAWSVTIGKTTHTVTHASDGTGSFSVESTIRGYSGANADITGKTITLDTIPRASTVSVSSGSVVCGSSVTVSVSRKSTAFTHTVQVKYGDTVKNTLVTKGTGSSFTLLQRLLRMRLLTLLVLACLVQYYVQRIMEQR